ncbi:Aspartyl/Asparaginyl beta-hydroxylase [seawater metagenome]|uniref:Aspartyl/Asparaginyl beta-hydroxylase n=1 Tax=seawater metagenome TaxID=1561972 RepID=A0A5E8CJJ0_9ZZZZ
MNYKNILLTLVCIIVIILLVLLVNIKILSDIGLNNIINKNSLISTDPVLNPDNFKECRILKKYWKIINKEAQDIINKKLNKDITQDVLFQNLTHDKWTKFYIKWGEIDPDAKNYMPFTTHLLNLLPNIKTGFLSILEPGSKIKPHNGPYSGFLRIHLGLDTPEDENCFIMVSGKKLIWKNGKIILFNDTYQHFVENNTNKRRIILFCDLVRPTKIPIKADIYNNIIMNLTWRNNRNKKSWVNMFPQLN